MKTDLTACEQFYGLHARPFSLTPDLRFSYPSRSHSRALEQVTRALRRREGLIVVTGEIGTGKTMLCRSLLETFEARTFLSVILDPMLTVEDLLRQVLTDFGLIAKDEEPQRHEPMTELSRHQLIATLHKFLSSLIPLNAHAVIMIDEAQHLSPQVLEEVRLLSNFETDEAKLLQIVLVGQPDLEDILARPIMLQLNQRVARRLRLEPLVEAEVQDYLERRLQVASRATDTAGPENDPGQNVRVRFSIDAISEIAALTGGVPRVINTLCDRVLEIGFEAREYIIDRDAVFEAANRLRMTPPRQARPIAEPPARTFPVRPAAAGVGVAALIIAVWLALRPGPRVATNDAPPSSPARSDPANAPSVPAAPVADAAGRYEITVASFRTEQRAAQVVTGLTRAGHRASARPDANGAWYVVVVGPFPTTEAAQAAQSTLAREGFSGTKVSER